MRDVGDPAALDAQSLELARKAHWAIDKVTRDIAERLHFNTAIAACMELLNELSAASARGTRRASASPPGCCARWRSRSCRTSPRSCGAGSGGAELWREPWPKADPRYLEHDSVTIVVQVNGKLRGKFDVARRARPRAARRARARARQRAFHLADAAEIVRVIVVPDKLVNFVVRTA